MFKLTPNKKILIGTIYFLSIVISVSMFTFTSEVSHNTLNALYVGVIMSVISFFVMVMFLKDETKLEKLHILLFTISFVPFLNFLLFVPMMFIMFYDLLEDSMEKLLNYNSK